MIYEFLRVVTHPRVLRRPRPVDEAWAFVNELLAAPSCTVLVATPSHADVAGQMIGEHGAVLRGNLLHAAYPVVAMREHGVRRIATRDADFHRFSSLEVIDPLTPG